MKPWIRLRACLAEGEEHLIEGCAPVLQDRCPHLMGAGCRAWLEPGTQDATLGPDFEGWERGSSPLSHLKLGASESLSASARKHSISLLHAWHIPARVTARSGHEHGAPVLQDRCPHLMGAGCRPWLEPGAHFVTAGPDFQTACPDLRNVCPHLRMVCPDRAHNRVSRPQ